MNPGSRSGRGRRQWPLWESVLKAKGVVFDSVLTERVGQAAELARNADGYGAVVAVGGDGTINEVLDGVIQSGRIGLRMGVLYSGTSPDFCRFHGIPLPPLQAVEALISGTSQRVDVARITHAVEGGGQKVAHFGCSSNVGLGASVASTSNRVRKFTGDFLGTCIAVVRSIASMRPLDLDLELDGSPIRLTKVNNLSILKNPFIASGLRLNLDLSADDGRLIVFAVHGKSRMSLLSVLPGFYSGNAASRTDVFVRDCSHLTIGCEEKVEIEFDGDSRGFLPATIEILPRALDLIGARHERV